MSATALQKLTIAYLRGAVVPFPLPFETGKKLTIIYGENATGKSTICDAFEFLSKGRVGSLENRGLGKTGRYWPSIGKEPSEISVTLEAVNGACRAAIVKGDVVVNPEESRPRVEVLRRSQILALVEAKPADRYAAISRFIDVTEVERSEEALRELIRDLTKGREVAVARVQENQDAIQQFWEAAGKPSKNSLVWAEGESKRDPNSSDAELAALGRLIAAYGKLTDYPNRLASLEQAQKTAEEAAAVTQKKVEISSQKIANDAGEMVEILESAHGYLEKHPSPAKCPLCESSEKVKGLSQRIAQRLGSFSILQNAQSENKKQQDALKRAKQQLETLQENAIKHLEDFEKARSSFTWSEDVKQPTVATPKDVKALLDFLAKTADLPGEWKKAEVARQDTKRFLSTLKRALKTLQDNTHAQKDLDVLLPKLSKGLEIMENERRMFTDSVLSKIAEDVGRIYEIVHPGEGLNKISLELDPNRRASLEISASFCGQVGTRPQAYFSDSHLDTLGLCVFLALAAMDGPENTILALDDVLASVDEPHVERLIEMLYAEAIKFRHCVITTHYRPWKQKLRWGWLKNGQCQFIELAKWTSGGGLALTRSVPDIERLRTLLAETPPDVQLVCAKAGVVLEAALDFLTQLYSCAVPRRPGDRYTLGDLLPSIDKKLRQSLQIEVLTGKNASGVATYQTTSLAPILDELTRIAQARNVFGCHFNELSFDLLDADGLSFGQKVLELMEILADPDAGWPRNDKSGKFWANSGETRRLYPLQQPK